VNRMCSFERRIHVVQALMVGWRVRAWIALEMSRMCSFERRIHVVEALMVGWRVRDWIALEM